MEIWSDFETKVFHQLDIDLPSEERLSSQLHNLFTAERYRVLAVSTVGHVNWGPG